MRTRLVFSTLFALLFLPSSSTDERNSSNDIEVYFGAGCFWHVQHAAAAAERKMLGRASEEYTAAVGYAGSREVGTNGKVCYHNSRKDSDYGIMGHTEVVRVLVPETRISDFAPFYFDLFLNGERADPQDVGPEYRAVIGLPAGISHPAFASFKEEADRRGMLLVPGKGKDPDTLGKRTVYVYDTAEFPFHQAEIFHQFHDDMGVDYPASYNSLRVAAARRGVLSPTGCPNDPLPTDL